MAEILETIMLVCFGISWPMNVIKNIKARSAKGMSLPFIAMIITGYIAGITAKVLNGKFNYVLVVYILNLVIVSVNVVIYFINRHYDKEREIALRGKQVEEEKKPVVQAAVKSSQSAL